MSSKHTLAGLALLAALGFASAAAAAANGQQIYQDSCAACHQPTGVGRPPAFPALVGDKVVGGPAAPMIATLLNGRGGMPAWKDQYNDEEIAAVATYVRTSWGNKGASVKPAEVAAVRKTKTAQAAGLQAH
jgi:mono/diheme cytochrome c family protein